MESKAKVEKQTRVGALKASENPNENGPTLRARKTVGIAEKALALKSTTQRTAMQRTALGDLSNKTAITVSYKISNLICSTLSSLSLCSTPAMFLFHLLERRKACKSHKSSRESYHSKKKKWYKLRRRKGKGLRCIADC